MKHSHEKVGPLETDAYKRQGVKTAVLLALLPLVGLCFVIALIGWPHGDSVELILVWAVRLIAFLYGALFLLIWSRKQADPDAGFVTRFGPPLLAAVLLISAIFEDAFSHWLHEETPHLPVRTVLLITALAQQLTMISFHGTAFLRALESSVFRRANPGLVLFGSFAAIIVAGTFFLKMPNATTDGISWLDALFTSTSAVCVTGLIVVDTATAFTPLGQTIILLLIQLGAFGIVTLTFFLAVLTGQGFSVASRLFLKDVLSLENLRNLRTAILFLILGIFVIEGLGCWGIYHVWKQTGVQIDNLAWGSLFHSVSAFCNAGFSVFSDGLADPRAAGNFPLQGIIMILIVLGGIGFPVLAEIGTRIFKGRKSGHDPARISVHVRLAVLVTFLLVAGGAILLFASERTVADTGEVPHWWVAVFNSVTARTAGFNISDIGMISGSATAVLIFLMFIGGSPGGFAGGIKTTTFALSMLNLKRILQARKDVELFGRRIDETLCNRAFAVLLLSLIWVFAATTLILFLQPEFLLIDVLFETVSAFSTVGLSRGITGGLSEASKLVITLTMFVGRIGVMNFFFSFLIVNPRERHFRYPKSRIIIE